MNDVFIYAFIGLLIGIVIGAGAGAVVLIKIYCQVVQSYNDIFRKLSSSIDENSKKISFIFDCIECLKNTEVDYDKYRAIKDAKSKMNLNNEF